MIEQTIQIKNFEVCFVETIYNELYEVQKKL